MKLADITTSELELELQRRKEAQVRESIPKQLSSPDFKDVIELCVCEIDGISAMRQNEDTKQYIYEAAMTAVFGDTVWKWINKQMK